MSPAWRRLLRKHEGKTLVELCRRPRIHERIAGFVVGFSEELILLHRLDWNLFLLDGYTLIRDQDVKQKRFFTRSTYWQVRALRSLDIRPQPLSDIVLTSWSEAVFSVAQKFPLIHVEREVKYPEECQIGIPIKVDDRFFKIENLNASGEWTGSYRMKTSDITRIDFGGGYERALAITAPRRKERNLRRS